MSKIVEIAQAEIGQGEVPLNSNITKYGTWFGLNGVAWCAIFVSWVYFKAGKALPKIGYTKGYAGCQTAYAYFKQNGWLVTEPIAGDIVLFDWNSDGRFDHTGIFKEKISASKFKSIEGNTSLKNDSNGGEVMERVRDFKVAIFARNPKG